MKTFLCTLIFLAAAAGAAAQTINVRADSNTGQLFAPLQLTGLGNVGLSSANPSFSLLLRDTETLTGNRTLTFTTGDAARLVALGGNFTTTGGTLNLTMSGTSSLVMPASGTVISTASVGTVTNAMLANSTITFGATAVPLGNTVSSFSLPGNINLTTAGTSAFIATGSFGGSSIYGGNGIVISEGTQIVIDGTFTGGGALGAELLKLNTQTDNINHHVNLYANSVRFFRISNAGNASLGATFTSSNVTFSGTLTPSQTSGIVGTTTNNNANAGSVGELVSATRASGSALALTTGTPLDVTSITLTAGDWDVWGVVDYALTGVTGTNFQSGSSSTSAAFGAQDTFAITPLVTTALSDTYSDRIPMARVTFAATTTLYLVGQETFSVGTSAAYGSIFARRRR